MSYSNNSPSPFNKQSISDREFYSHIENTLDGGTDKRVQDTVAAGKLDTLIGLSGGAVNPGVISTNNSSSTPLGLAGIFTGIGEDMTNFSSVALNAISDQNSSVNGLKIEFSSDNVNWDIVFSFSLLKNVPQTHTFAVIAKYMRVVYSNGDTAQGAFRLQVVLHRQKPRQQNGGVETSIKRYEDAGLSRTVNDNNFDRNTGRIDFESVKTLSGYNENVDTTERFIAPDNLINPFPTNAESLRIKAGGNANDDVAGSGAQYITLKFLDGSFNEQTETIATAGASASSGTSALGRRLVEACVNGAGSYGGVNAGKITIENVTTGDILGTIEAGEGEMRQNVITVPANKTYYLRQLEVTVENALADVSIMKRENAHLTFAPFGPKRLIHKFPAVQGPVDKEFDTYIKVPSKSDIWLSGKKRLGSSDALVSGHLDFSVVDVDAALLFSNTLSTHFAGGTNYVNCGANASLQFADTDAFSLEAWVKADTITIGDVIISNFNTSSGFVGYELYLDGNGHPVFRTLGTSGGYTLTALTATINIGQWYHIVVTKTTAVDTSAVALYVNGIPYSLSGSGSLTGTIAGGGNFTIGARMNGSDSLNGNIDEVSAWSKALSLSEVTEIYNAATVLNLNATTPAPNIVSWWRMGDNDTHPTIKDVLGLNDGTMVNMTPADFQTDTP